MQYEETLASYKKLFRRSRLLLLAIVTPTITRSRIVQSGCRGVTSRFGSMELHGLKSFCAHPSLRDESSNLVKGFPYSGRTNLDLLESFSGSAMSTVDLHLWIDSIPSLCLRVPSLERWKHDFCEFAWRGKRIRTFQTPTYHLFSFQFLIIKL